MAALLLAVTGADAARVSLPKWASQHTRTQVPAADYISEDADWVVVYSEVLIGRSAAGGMRQTWRQVLAAVGEERQPLVLAVGYDDASQTLDGPRVWVPGGVGYGAMDVDRASVEIPSLEGGTLSADRTRYLKTRPIKPGRKNVVAEWVIEDLDAFPGELLLLPLSPHPVMEWQVRAEGDDITLTRLQDGALTPLASDGLSLAQVPAVRHLLANQGNWSSSLLGAIPTVHASVLPREQQSWSALSKRVLALFHQAVAADEQRSYDAQARALIAGATSDRERLGRLADFAQSLAYRDVQWGIGAYLPESPHEVLRSRTADCKGKSVLLQALLAAVGIRSVPVLASIQDRYLDLREPATAFAFNHVVLAVDLSGDEALPGRLASGPGKGWVLFDPTDPLATFGQPVRRLSGTLGLWLDESGTLFEIQPAAPPPPESVTLDFAVDTQGNAHFDATLTGPSPLAEIVTENNSGGELTARSEALIARSLASALPGLEIQQVHLTPADHVNSTPQRLTITGLIPDVLRPLAGSIHTLSAPTTLLDQLISLDTRQLIWERPDPQVIVGEQWRLDPCCFARDYRLELRMALSLPPAWTVQRQPALAEVRTPWLEASAGPQSSAAPGDPPTWDLRLRLRRGAFPTLSGEERTAQLNAVTRVMREPFLIRKGAR